ncbi:MAG: DUF5615 family PIN-like protein [Chloroflexota bacterium]|nr:DUF5615 family PIN-like protein [Chloroflexota bacterium]
MTPPRFLLDEHILQATQSQLLRLDAEIDVLAVGQPLAPPKGTSDPDILVWIEKRGYILVTANRRTISEHVRAHYAAGRSIPGILLLKRGVSLGQVIEQLYLLWAASDAEEYVDRILYLPL